MSFPLPRDRWLWLGLGIFTICAAYTAWRIPTQASSAPQTTPEKAAKQGVWEVTQDTEDALSEEALFTLAKSSTGQEIRQSATKILLDRFLHSPSALRSFKSDLASKDARKREEAVSLVRYVLKHADLTSRRALLHDKEIQRLLSSPTTSASLAGRGRAGSSDYDLGFLSPVLPGLSRTFTGAPGSLDPPPPSSTYQPRSRENLSRLGEGEAEARRRRREAVVLNEGDHPLGQGDIIQRGFASEDEEEEGLIEEAEEE